MGTGYSRVIRGLLLLSCAALVLSAPAAAQAPDGFWGGAYAVSANERVTVYASNAYPVDEATTQRWANFLGSLLHGSELASVSVYLVPPAQVARMCGTRGEVYGCYLNNRIVAQGEDTRDATTAGVLAHEYGHHVATHRSNEPWPAAAWGTKRWASYLQVCAKARAKQMFPGSQSPLLYLFNPGEGFAEAYRFLNEQRAGLPHGRWRVDEVFSPNARALALVEQDVLEPWSGNTTLILRGRSRVVKVATPLDGTFSVAAQGQPRVRIQIFAGKKRVARGSGSLSTQVCGVRTLTLRLSRLATLAVSRP